MISAVFPVLSRAGRRVTGWAPRCVLGVCFVYLGLNKALNPGDFLKAVHEYGFVEQSLHLTWIAALLPWFEVFCGVLLLMGIWVRGTAFSVLGMLLFFSALVLHRALRLHETSGIPFWEIRFDCGCGNGPVLVGRKLVENTVLAAMSLALVLSRKR